MVRETDVGAGGTLSALLLPGTRDSRDGDLSVFVVVMIVVVGDGAVTWTHSPLEAAVEGPPASLVWVSVRAVVAAAADAGTTRS